MQTYQNILTIRTKYASGYNLLWNSNTGEVHFTGSACRGSHHLDTMVAEHMHFLTGYYSWDGVRWQLYIVQWDPLTAPYAPNGVTYSNCGHCHPQIAARRAA